MSIRMMTHQTIIAGDLSDASLVRAARETTIDVENMKRIAGYSGTDGNAYTSGAVFLSNRIVTIQSIILRMDTLEMWIHFSPPGTNPMPLNPTYLR